MAFRELAKDKSTPTMTAHSKRIVDVNGVEWDALCNFGFGVHSAVPAGSPSGTPIRFVIDPTYTKRAEAKRKRMANKTEEK